jgi:hypothetical protein
MVIKNGNLKGITEILKSPANLYYSLRQKRLRK